MSSEIDTIFLLHKVSLFKDVPIDALIPLSHFTKRIYLDAGETLFEQGDFGDALYLMIEGELEVINGEQVVSHIMVGECVGELAVLDWEARSATVKAVEESGQSGLN